MIIRLSSDDLQRIIGKNSIYHLLNEKFKKYVKGLVNKNWVKEIVNPVLPSQTPRDRTTFSNKK